MSDDKTEGEVRDAETSEGVELDKTTPLGDKLVTKYMRRALVVPGILVLLLLVSGGLAAWLYYAQYRPDKQTDAASAQTAVNAARDGTVALLSYKPETLDQDFAAAKTHLTGDFLNYYNDFTQQIVTPAAKQKSVSTQAQVASAAVSELHPNSAAVLVFVDQSTTSKDRPEPAMASSTVMVSMTKVDGNWLITKFDPV